MKGARMRSRLIAIALVGLLISMLCVSPVWARGDRTLDRDGDPVIVKGDQLPSFRGVSLGRLLVYAYTGGAWQQIPWQFDEVSNGLIVPTEDGELDDDDELVFMGADTGDQAPPTIWIGDEESRQNARYEVKVTDPTDTSKVGWVYVYRSTTLTNQITKDYVDVDATQQSFSADRYELGWLRGKLGVERLEMNGSGVDVLDRTKIRLQMQGMALQTEDKLNLDGPMTAYRDGRVRAIAGWREGMAFAQTIAYGSMFQDVVSLDFSRVPRPVLWMRMSADLDPAAIGSTYYDANTVAGVTVDGVPDAITTSPASPWMQVSGSTGTVLQVIELDKLMGTKSTYYKDDATIDNSDTGDKKSYSDTGVYVENPTGKVILSLWYYVLPANQPIVGATYHSYALGPLSAQATSQSYGAGFTIYLPVILKAQ